MAGARRGASRELWSEKAAGAADPELRLIQIEASLSRTAARAWRWVAIREGSDAALAAGIARVLLEERLVAAKGPLPQMSIEEAAAQSGLSGEAIRELAHTIVEKRPALVITPEANPAIAALNVLLGAVGAPGGIVVKNKTAPAHIPLEANSDSYRALLIDSTVPWDFAPQTNVRGVSVRRLGWRREHGRLVAARARISGRTHGCAHGAHFRGQKPTALAMNLLTQPTETKSAAQLLWQNRFHPARHRKTHPRAVRATLPGEAGHDLCRPTYRGCGIRFRAKIGRAIA